MDLLPGSRDRQGLPESVAFWKKRIEQNDPDKTFSVGIINGPSGSGKSSLVKAGIIPQLDNSIIAIHVDATAEDNESRLLHGLQRKVESTRDSEDLTQAMIQIRRAETIKVVLFIDQFEQWLNSHRSTRRTELVD
ncbi:MAG: ATP-binding protein, partial [Pirellula sp.]